MNCMYCGGTHVLLSGEPCPYCKEEDLEMDAHTHCLTIPRDYQGVKFNVEAVPDDLGGEYSRTLDKLYQDVIHLKNKKNYLIASPAKHSKTILCYSAIQMLYQQHIPTFPLLDTGELRRVMLDMEQGVRSYVLEDMDAVDSFIYSSPILFVRIPNMITYTTIDTMLILLDRRTRRSNYTIFIYNGTVDDLNRVDKRKKLQSLYLDGIMGTLIVKSYNNPLVDESHGEDGGEKESELEHK